MSAGPPRRRIEAFGTEVADRARTVARLRVQVQRAVEGLLGGLHPSRRQGASAVFAEHFPYRAGDEPRWIDWRATARADRVVVRRFEQESRLRALLLLDSSPSMAFAGCIPSGNALSKAWHGALLLGTLGWLLRAQGDALGGAPFDESLGEWIPPNHRPDAWDRLAELWVRALEATTGAERTDVAGALRGAAERGPGRGLLVVASDLLTPLDALGETLGALRRLGHDPWVIHVLHPDELALPAVGPARFRDPEGGEVVLADPAAAADGYHREVADFLRRAEARCVEAGARYVRSVVGEPLAPVLGRLLPPGPGVGG